MKDQLHYSDNGTERQRSNSGIHNAPKGTEVSDTAISSILPLLEICLLQHILRFIDFASKIRRAASVRMIGNHNLPMGVLDLRLHRRAVSK